MADISRRFLQEHRTLREEGREFSSDYPEAARFLDPDNVEDRDPYVERLTESFAFLTGRIRETLAVEEDGLTRHLLDLLVPDLAQPLPSVTVVEFHPRRFHPGPCTVAAGSEVRTATLRETRSPCRFTLNHDVQIQSYGAKSAKLHQTESGATPLELELECHSELARGYWPEHIHFYLHGDPSTVWAMRFALLRRTTRIQRMRNQQWEDASDLRFERLDRPGYATKRSMPGPFSDARDFLCADDRFRFVDLVGAESARMAIEEPLRIVVDFAGALPRGLTRAVNASLFRSHAAVVVNRFMETCQSHSWDHTASTAPVVPQSGRHVEILDVVSVKGLDVSATSRRTVFHRYSSYRTQPGQSHFQVLRRTKPDGRHSTAISLGGFDPNQELRNQYLAIEAECSDASAPHELVQPADICAPGPGIPESLTMAGLVRPSVSFRPHAGTDSRSQLLAFAAGHFEGWLDANRLKDGLRQVLWDPSESKRSLIESIQEVQTTNDHILDMGVAWRRMHTTVRLRDTTCTPETWERLGVIDAFGSVLLGIVRDATPIGSTTALTVVVEPAGVVLEWPASLPHRSH
ncbi:MAG: hypothetical protein RL173_1788 [Fibrobacterota bacterium]|jgi:type VI secretion system protein ImpG